MNRSFIIARALAVIGALGLSVPAFAETICLRKAPDPSLYTAPAAKATEAKAPVAVKAPTFSAVVLSQDAAAYAAKGFTVVDCPSVEKQAQFRESICGAAEQGNSYLRARLERLFGDKPAKICASARAAVTLAIKVPPPGPTLRPSASPPSAVPTSEASPQK